MTISFYEGLTRNPEIGNTPVWVLSNIWRLGQVRNTKFGTNISNKMLLIPAKCQGYSFYRFWVIKGKPTVGQGVRYPFQIRFNVPKALVCFSVSCIFNRFSLFFSCILNCSYLFFKSFSKRITNKLSLFYYSPLIRTNNIFSPTRHSFLSTLPDDNADIFANSLLISYFSVSSLILLSATFHQD